MKEMLDGEEEEDEAATEPASATSQLPPVEIDLGSVQEV